MWATWLLLSVLPFGSGCAGWKYKNPLNLPEDVHAQKEERRAEIIKDFEMKRSFALLNAAQARLGQGDEAGSREALDKLLKLSPDHVAARLMKAEIHLVNYQLEEARQEVETVLAKNPGNPQALHAMGLIKEASGNAEESADYFGQAAELAPTDPQITLDYESTIDPRYSQAGMRPEKWQGAEEEQSPENGPNATDKTTQIRLLAMERAANSPRTAAILRRAMAAMAAGESDSAITQVRQAINLEPQNSRLPRQVALEALRSNHPEVASAILQTALDHLPQSGELYRLYGLSLYRQQQFRPAEIALRKAVTLDNHDALAYFLLGQVLARLGQSEQSQEFLKEACRLDSTLSAHTQTR